MNVSYDGVGQVCATFLGTNISEGHVVKLTGNGTVGECAAGDSFFGAALCAKDDACTVQVRGFVTVPYSGTAPTAGWTALTADGGGGVKAAESASAGTKAAAGDTGRKYAVASVDTAGQTVTILL